MLETIIKLFGYVIEAFKPAPRTVDIVDAHKKAKEIDSEIEKKLDDNSGS